MNTSLDPGQVVVTLTLADGRVAATRVSCVRPDVVSLLRGQVADRAVALVPLIYSLCGKAQGIAARAALAAARGTAVAAHVDVEALNEAVREHAWQLLMNWPPQFGLEPDEPFFVRLLRAPAEARSGLADELRAHPGLAALRDQLRTDGASGESILLSRVEACLAEVKNYLDGRMQTLGTVAAESVADGIGRASVATARGLLVHELRLDADRVLAYTITAPTDRHFAADGPVAATLASLRSMPKDEAGRMAEHVVMAFDPCVPWQCRFL